MSLSVVTVQGRRVLHGQVPGAAIVGGGNRIGFAEQTANQTTSSATYETIPGMTMAVQVPSGPWRVGYRLPLEVVVSGAVGNVGLFRDLPGVEQYQSLNFDLPRAGAANHRHIVANPGLWIPSGLIDIDDVPVGSMQTFRLRWKRESGTGALNIGVAFLTTQLESCQMWAETG